MSALAVITGLVGGFVLGTVLLFLSFRVIKGARGHLARSAVAYVVMLVCGAVVAGGILFTLIEVASARAVLAVPVALCFAALSQYFTGILLMRKVAVRPGVAVAVPVLLILVLGCASGIPLARKVDTRAMQMRQLFVLKQIHGQLIPYLYETEPLDMPVPPSFRALASKDPSLSSGTVAASDIWYLPEWLAASGIPVTACQFRHLKNDFPLIWLKDSSGQAVPMADVFGSCSLMEQKDFATLLNMTTEYMRNTITPLPEREWTLADGSKKWTGSFLCIGPNRKRDIMSGAPEKNGTYVEISKVGWVDLDALSIADREYISSLTSSTNAP